MLKIDIQLFGLDPELVTKIMDPDPEKRTD